MTADACNFQSSFMTWDVPYRPDPRPHARHNTPLGNLARIQIEALIDVRAYGPLARAQQRRYDDLVALERQLLRWLNGGPSDLSEAATS